MDRDAHEPSTDITLLLQKWQNGDRAAFDHLIPLVYDELHAIASRYVAYERRARTLQTAGLLHEAYVKLIGQRSVNWQNRAHFFAIAAHVMRRILLDHARRRQREKRGKLVELRFFGGLTVEETATVLDISPATVKREGATAKGWLYRALTCGPEGRHA